MRTYTIAVEHTNGDIYYLHSVEVYDNSCKFVWSKDISAGAKTEDKGCIKPLFDKVKRARPGLNVQIVGKETKE